MVIISYFATCIYEDQYPEVEGNILFSQTPKKGDVVVLPSSLMGVSPKPIFGIVHFCTQDLTMNVYIPDEQQELKKQVTEKQVLF
ncbi:hypothetical protein CWATWH0402_1654 [Crocosphaera watsonii WH 0402]|uniref:Uncharacterized protein n=1 Tax=Crocosphaera watsonii WH 0402 TaxID=1284629 RepID=T2K0N3_CROWT|nr:hypothetical protein [Crocosphaera watsonii]MCH2231844.1 hypothetical protein [Crocinitomicaceae bacterium]CCQ71059.1 hypothetical protein CWATWH0402_1654 [Crocosphaera watsonii WH 0402]